MQPQSRNPVKFEVHRSERPADIRRELPGILLACSRATSNLHPPAGSFRLAVWPGKRSTSVTSLLDCHPEMNGCPFSSNLQQPPLEAMALSDSDIAPTRDCLKSMV